MLRMIMEAYLCLSRPTIKENHPTKDPVLSPVPNNIG